MKLVSIYFTAKVEYVHSFCKKVINRLKWLFAVEYSQDICIPFVNIGYIYRRKEFL